MKQAVMFDKADIRDLHRGRMKEITVGESTVLIGFRDTRDPKMLRRMAKIRAARGKKKRDVKEG